MVKKKDSEKSSQNEENNRSNNIENGENDEPNFSDPEGFVDDITDDGMFYFLTRFRSWFFVHMAACRVSSHAGHYYIDVLLIRITQAVSYYYALYAIKV